MSFKKSPKRKRNESDGERKDPDRAQSYKVELPAIVVTAHDSQASDTRLSIIAAVEEGTSWYDLLENKIGLGVTSRKWIEDHPELIDTNKSPLIMRLAYELCSVSDTKYDTENDSLKNEVYDCKCSVFDAKKMLSFFEVVSSLVEKSDRKRFVEFVCQKGDVELLERICQKEAKDKGCNAKLKEKYPWKGEFTGFTLIELLQYVLKQPCSSAIVLCLTVKVYGMSHNVYNGRQYLENFQILSVKGRLDQPDLVIEECLKTAIESGYSDSVLVMLSGDIYHSIRLMRYKRFEEEEVFRDALYMIKETVADVASSWVEEESRRSCRDELLGLLAKGIEVDIEKLKAIDLIDELKNREIKLPKDDKISKDRLIEMFKRDIGEKVHIRIGKNVVGALISTLFFQYHDNWTELENDGNPFKIGISPQDKNRRETEIKELRNNADSTGFIRNLILKLIQLLNTSSHLSNNWFFREVLENVVNHKLEKLKAVCAAICKEPMQNLLQNKKINENISDALEHFGVNVSSFDKMPSETQLFRSSISSKDADELEGSIRDNAKEVSGEIEIDGKVVSVLIRQLTKKIAYLKLMKKALGLSEDEEKKLKKTVLEAREAMKKGLHVLGNDDKCVNIKDICILFEVIYSEKECKYEKEIQLICPKKCRQLMNLIIEREEVNTLFTDVLSKPQYEENSAPLSLRQLRDMISYLKCKNEVKDLTKNEQEELEAAVLEGTEAIKEGLKMYASNSKSVDLEDIFSLFLAVYSEINMEEKTEIELVCRKCRKQLLEMILEREEFNDLSTEASGEPQFDKDSILAFTRQSSKVIADLKSKREELGLTTDEEEELRKAVIKANDAIKKGISVFTSCFNYYDAENIFLLFELINSEIERQHAREIVKLVVEKDNLQLLTMIVDREHEEGLKEESFHLSFFSS